MMMRVLLVICLLTLGALAASAQDSRNPTAKKKKLDYMVTPDYAKWASVRKAFYEHPYNKYYDRLVEEYYKRKEEVIKRNQKLAKKLEKPQYSDPSYFGHKRKPKKRPVGKRKYCKECGIVH